MTLEEFEKGIAEQLPNKGIPEETEFSETHKHRTPNGGDYSTAYFYDKNGNPCKKEDAAYMNIIEFTEDGVRVNETYGAINNG